MRKRFNRKEYYKKHKNKLLQYNKEYYQKNKDYFRLYNKKYSQKPNHKKLKNKRTKEHRRKYPQKYKARYTGYTKTKLDSNCLFCNTTKDLQRHHPNYNESLRINTMCRQCHYNFA